MRRLFTLVIIIFSTAIFISCSGTEKMVQETDEIQPQEENHPSWYTPQTVVNTDSSMLAYTAAIDNDSTAVISKSAQAGETDLKTYVSDKLEHIRSEAIEEHGSANLDSPDFLIALRKTDELIDDLAMTEKTEIKQVEGYDSYRGFVEISVSKEKLIEQIGERLSAHEEAWNAMKGSEAFQNF